MGAPPTTADTVFYRSKQLLRDFDAKPLLVLGKVEFLAQSAVNSEAFEILSWGPQRKGGWRVPLLIQVMV